jgi:hypothetical protein
MKWTVRLYDPQRDEDGAVYICHTSNRCEAWTQIVWLAYAYLDKGGAFDISVSVADEDSADRR